ncbi:MAG TPA: hypothetical protein VJ729_02970 [Nitrososphaeraceae archaeon]|nr:hypothetical protein [Nitrososphaeraceae archaeon]
MTERRTKTTYYTRTHGQHIRRIQQIISKILVTFSFYDVWVKLLPELLGYVLEEQRYVW